MELKLIVVRSPDIKVLSEFYTLLGLRFEYHRHGNSRLHYTATIGPTVFEIYPLLKGQDAADQHLRLGFSIPDFDHTIDILRHLGTPVLAEPEQAALGYYAVIADPDGRKVEVYKEE